MSDDRTRDGRTGYGLLAEFRTGDELLDAARRAHSAGYCSLEAYAPFPIEGLEIAIGANPRSAQRVALFTLLGGVLGGIGGYAMQWYSAVLAFPLNVGGRPLHSWPAFVPVTFETTLLGAAVVAVVAMLLASGLPRLHHPIFAAPDFEFATRHRFFLCLLSSDAQFDEEGARAFLGELRPLRVVAVPDSAEAQR